MNKKISKKNACNHLNAIGSDFYQRGSYTVEAAISVTIAMLILFVIIFSYMIMLQRIALSQIAKQAAAQGAEVWNDSRRSINDGILHKNEKEDSLYFRVFNDSFMSQFKYEETILRHELESKKDDAGDSTKNRGLEAKKIAKISEMIHLKLKGTVLKPEATYVTIIYDNQLIDRKLTVQLEQIVKLPFAPFSIFYKGKQEIRIKAIGIAAVIEPAEMIRNTDLLLEYGKNISGEIDLNQIFEKIKSIKQQ